MKSCNCSDAFILTSPGSATRPPSSCASIPRSSPWEGRAAPAISTSNPETSVPPLACPLGAARRRLLAPFARPARHLLPLPLDRAGLSIPVFQARFSEALLPRPERLQRPQLRPARHRRCRGRSTSGRRPRRRHARLGHDVRRLPQHQSGPGRLSPGTQPSLARSAHDLAPARAARPGPAFPGTATLAGAPGRLFKFSRISLFTDHPSLQGNMRRIEPVSAQVS